MAFNIIQGDITQLRVDAIVNAANTELLMGGGVCGAIFRAAGSLQLQKACNEIGSIQTGKAVITPGFNLLAKYVIHTAGPIYHQHSPEKSKELLHSSYMESLKVALENRCESIAFPLISSGIYSYPKEESIEVAIKSIEEFLETHDMGIYLVAYDKETLQQCEKILTR